jgi:DMSO/TMAO reductase YedYZ molybdopterin-dependent catalytic subunit
VVDRIKGVINTGGVLVASREVEDALYTHPAVAEVAVIAVPDEKWIEAITGPPRAGPGRRPQRLPDQQKAAFYGLSDAQLGPSWRLELVGPAGTLRLDRDELLALPQHEAALPIACVEGWSSADQRWRGVRLSDLAGLVGARGAAAVLVESVVPVGAFNAASLRGNQIRDPLSLLALRVNGAELSRDHGYPARVIVGANPGVHNTKWVARMSFSP